VTEAEGRRKPAKVPRRQDPAAVDPAAKLVHTCSATFSWWALRTPGHSADRRAWSAPWWQTREEPGGSVRRDLAAVGIQPDRTSN
jgi:hypothetical protein